MVHQISNTTSITMRLFRQKDDGKWDDVISEVESELKRLLSY